MPLENKDPVVYLQDNGDGTTTEVSNDPRWHEAKLAKKIREQMAAEDAEAASVNGGYMSQTAADLKAELKKRQKERDIDTSGVSTKAQLAELLEKDDESQAAANQAGGQGS